MKLINTSIEEEECIALVQYLDLLALSGRVRLYTHVPNETFTKSWSQKAKNKRMGVRKGFPDYVIAGRNKAIVIEMKRVSGGRVSPEQKAWHEELNKIGLPAFICNGFDEARAVIDRELK